MQNFKRNVAIKVNISNLMEGDFVKEENNSYILLENEKIFRVNLIATTLVKSEELGLNYKSLTVDDGTGKSRPRCYRLRTGGPGAQAQYR